MKKEEIIIYSEETNTPVIQTPGRKFPGSVLQGDTLNSYFRISKIILELIKNKDFQNDDLIVEAEELHLLLYARLNHYQQTLKKEGLEIPYYPELLPSDLIADRIDLHEFNDDENNHP